MKKALSFIVLLALLVLGALYMLDKHKKAAPVEPVVEQPVEVTKEEPVKPVPKDISYDAGTLIMGADGIGMSAALTTAQASINTLIMEKTSTPKTNIGDKASDVLTKLVEDIKNTSIPLIADTEIKELLIKDGNIVGVKGTDKDGNNITVNTENMVITDPSYKTLFEKIGQVTVNENGEVIGPDNVPIGGLYIAGDMVSAIPPNNTAGPITWTAESMISAGQKIAQSVINRINHITDLDKQKSALENAVNSTPEDKNEDAGKSADTKNDSSDNDVTITRNGEQIKIILPEGILFDYDRAIVRGRFLKPLREISKIFKEYKDTDIVIEGHTDNKGQRWYNRDLSKRRATSVRDYIWLQGIPKRRMTIIGQGEDHPIASNNTPKGRAKNRRVEIRITPKK